jgi:hypothetical protein
MSAELILLAAEYAFGASQAFSTLRQTLERWHKLGISTVPAAREEYEKNGAAPQVKKAAALNYPQRKYTQSDYDSFITKLIDDEDDA